MNSILRSALVGVLVLAGVPLCPDGARAQEIVAAKSGDAARSLLPPDRATLWNPGMRAVGGIPARTTVCATLAPLGAGGDDTSQIQRAIDSCQPGQVVQLAAGTFSINGRNYLVLNKGITLRGAGPGKSILSKPDGAKPYREAPGPNPSPLIVVGPSLFARSNNSNWIAGSTALLTNAENGAYSVMVGDTTGLRPGQIVLLDETSRATWQTDPQGRGRVWAASDWRVVWKKHDPPVQWVDDFAPGSDPSTPGSAGGWFARLDRPTSELKQIARIDGPTVTFTTPIHISYRTLNAAELSRFGTPFVVNAGVEDLTLIGGDKGNLRFQWAAMSWAKNVENTQWHGEGFSIDSSFRIELRDFYVHDAAWAQPGGAGYAISLSFGSSENLIENGIAVRANKIMVSRSAGAGSVVGYNYMDMGYINTQGHWIEVGLNASHMVGSHHLLFEGNYGFNADSDNTHGNSIYLTFFRNHLRGIRAPFENQAGGLIDDLRDSKAGPKRAAGLMAFSYWMSFLGNVLGAPGEMQGWSYETSFGGKPGIWMLGWDDVKPYRVDAKVAATTLRHGNFDYVTTTVNWDPARTDKALPPSLYLTQRPDFFDAGRGYAWPWVDPVGETKLHALPAKARYEAGTPFVQP